MENDGKARTLNPGTVLTVYSGPTGDLPQNQSQRPDISLLVWFKDVHTDTFIQDLRGHVAFGAHSSVVPYIQVVVGLRMSDSQAYQNTQEKPFSDFRSTVKVVQLYCAINILHFFNKNQL